MSDIALMWHGSLQWGRRHVEEWHFLIEVYSASLEAVERHADVRLTLQFGGQDVEWFSKTHPEFVDQVKRLIERGQVEIAMGGYSHNFQGATPYVNRCNLTYAQEVCQRVFGVDASGYWPAESMLNRGMPRTLHEAGFTYTMFDSLNARHAGALEYAITGNTYRLRGAFGEEIDGLPVSRFTDCTRRGESAGIQAFAMGPDYYKNDTSIILSRASRTPLVVEVSDWEHFNARETDSTHDIMMGTSNIGSRRNRVDPDKLQAWERILVELLEAGHTFVTCREALERHARADVLDLVDGRDYTKNDLTRLVDATAWWGARGGGLAGRRDPHRMSDQESYTYSFAGARALDHFRDLRVHRGTLPDDDPELVARTRDVLISFCSAHRSGGEDFTVKQQLLDRVNRAIAAFHDEAKAALGQDRRLFLPAGLPSGYWPIPANDDTLVAGTARLKSPDGNDTLAIIEQSASAVACLDRTHRVWLRGPCEPGLYSLKPLTGADTSSSLQVEETEDGLLLTASDGLLRFDAWNAGRIADWQVGGFAPYRELGAIEARVHWQDSPLLDEVRCELSAERVNAGIVVSSEFDLEDLTVRRSWRVTDDLRCCQLDVRFEGRNFQYLAPFSYRLEPRAFGRDGKILMVAEGYTEASAEPLMVSDSVHHLGSELIGFAGRGGVAGLAVNRLCSSPILRRNPLSGTFILMDSRPVGHSDDAFAYTFAQEPVFEATLRIEPGGDLDSFKGWQSFHSHPPIAWGGTPYLKQADLPWMAEYPHISEVNPYF